MLIEQASKRRAYNSYTFVGLEGPAEMVVIDTPIPAGVVELDTNVGLSSDSVDTHMALVDTGGYFVASGDCGNNPPYSTINTELTAGYYGLVLSEFQTTAVDSLIPDVPYRPFLFVGDFFNKQDDDARPISFDEKGRVVLEITPDGDASPLVTTDELLIGHPSIVDAGVPEVVVYCFQVV